MDDGGFIIIIHSYNITLYAYTTTWPKVFGHQLIINQ